MSSSPHTTLSATDRQGRVWWRDLRYPGGRWHADGRSPEFTDMLIFLWGPITLIEKEADRA